MKALLLLLLVVAVAWWWRSRQSVAKDDSQAGKPAAPELLNMVRCNHCGMHVPGDEAVVGEKGLYCSINHRQQSEP